MPCPPPKPLSGRDTAYVGPAYTTGPAATAAAIAFAQTVAEIDAGLESNKPQNDCPPGCRKRVTNVVVAITASGARRFTPIALLASLFNLRWMYEGYARFDWRSAYMR